MIFEFNNSKLVGLIASLVFLVIAPFSIASQDENDTPVMSDSVFAMAKINQSDAKKLGLDYPSVIAFLGKKNTYILFEGGDELLKIGQELDGKYLIVRNINRGLLIKDKQVWGKFILIYYKGGMAIDADEKAKLETLGFQKNWSGSYFPGYMKQIDVKGIAFQPIKPTTKQEQDFKITRDFDFYNAEVATPSVFSKIKSAATTIVTAPLVIVAGAMWGMTVVSMGVTGSH